MKHIKGDSVFLKIVKKSSLAFKIKRIAPQCFSIWQEKTKRRHPDYLLKATSETLIEDMFSSFAQALCSLFVEEKKEKRNIPGWSIGFIFGYTSSCLTTNWCYQYVYTETDKYKQLMFMKAIALYLGVDIEAVKRIEKLYNYLITSKTTVSEQTSKQHERIISLKDFKTKMAPSKNFQNSIITYLNSLLLQKHNIIFDNLLKRNEEIDLDHFFNDDEIEKLILDAGAACHDT